MKADVLTLDATKAGTIDLDEGLFGLPERADILNRVVVWQLAKRRAGTQSVKQRTQVSGTTKKFGKQKGGGSARHGSRKAGIFVGGGKVHGAQPRSYEHDLPKKIRALGLKTALSVKALGGKLVVIEDLVLSAGKTKELVDKFAKLNITSALFIDGAQVDGNFKLAASNIPLVDVLPVQGANVYDILRRDVLVLTKAAVAGLEERLK
ncbi:50S ribosomal protein L4 [Govanella unica]|uniref:Large ribosomal subunit protein uL4 n=1 Tax=Govanella unica TaxID=2975056 RepID=A0A9X3TW64_9PROT|nr:50S ribosomal protein L4 [Govania unica]MDA5193056.1 50S ribosomal protein L4 [Govania unica]